MDIAPENGWLEDFLVSAYFSGAFAVSFRDGTTQLSNEKNPGWLGYIGNMLPRYMGVIISHCKDPYKPTSIMESKKGFLRG